MGSFKIRHSRDGQLLSERTYQNNMFLEGAVEFINVGLRGQTAPLSFEIGFITGTPARTDTLAVHPGWVEYTGYTPTTRPAWIPDAPYILDSQQVIAENVANPIKICINTKGTIDELFLASTKLISHVSVSLDVEAGDDLEIVYSFKLLTNILSTSSLTSEGGLYLLNAYFLGTGAATTFYHGLVSAAGGSTFSGNDTLLSHAGWTELAETRPSITFGVPTSLVTLLANATEGPDARTISLSTTNLIPMSQNNVVKGDFFATSVDNSGLLIMQGLYTSGPNITEHVDGSLTLGASFEMLNNF